VPSFIANFQKRRTRAASRIIDGGVIGRFRVAYAENPRDYAADLSGSVELTLALATLSSEMPIVTAAGPVWILGKKNLTLGPKGRQGTINVTG